MERKIRKSNLLRIIYCIVRTMRKNQLKNQVSDINQNCLENHLHSDICIFDDAWSIYQTIFGDHVRYHQYDVNEYISFIRTDHRNDTYVFSISVSSFQNWDMVCMRIDISNDHRWADAYFQLASSYGDVSRLAGNMIVFVLVVATTCYPVSYFDDP